VGEFEVAAGVEIRCEREGLDPEQELMAVLGEREEGDFWNAVKTNLQAGRIRMVFVADEIPAELRRIVEFLNQQLDPAEVIALEVRQYQGEGITSLIPRVIGSTARAEQKKSASRPSRQWDEASFFAHLEARGDPERDIRIARMLLDWGKETTTRIWWGKGAKSGSFIPVLHAGSASFYPVRISSGYVGARVEMGFGDRQAPPFDQEGARKELLNRIVEIPNVSLPADSYNRFPSFALADLADEASAARLTGVLDWAIQEVRRHLATAKPPDA
jgi:hypothetical protein